LKVKTLLAVGSASIGAMAFASPALALPGDDAVLSQSPFRLNPATLEPNCQLGGRLSAVHIDVGGETSQEAHISVANGANYSVDQVLIPSRTDGYKVYNEFDTGTINNDVDVDPNQTATDLRSYNGGSIPAADIIVCVSDHEDAGQNEPYLQENGGLVSAKNRPVIKPIVSCLGVSAVEPLNTYKVGFGYEVLRGYDPIATTDPNARDTNGDGIVDAVRMNPREDGAFDARRVNDVDSFGEAFSGDLADYGQTRLFSLAGDPTAWTLSNNNDPDTLAHLITFTAQGDLPLSWTLRASLAGSATKQSVTLTDSDLRAWEASWQAYYKGGPKPTMLLCPGTNSPAPATTVVVNLPQQAQSVAPPAAPAQVITREVTTVQTVAGPTKYVVKKAKKAKAARKACMRKAKAKHGAKRHKAMRRCNRG
jgi:hypothetical protein